MIRTATLPRNASCTTLVVTMDEPTTPARPVPEKDEPEDEPRSRPEPQAAVTATAPNGTPAGPRLVDRIRSMVGLKSNGSLRDNLESALSDEDDQETAFSPEERLMLRNILRLREIRSDDVSVPRADIDAVDETVTLGELVRKFRESGHSRMPVYTETLDDPRGIVHIKDVMAYITDPVTGQEADDAQEAAPSLSLREVDYSVRLMDTKLIRSVLFVPPSMPVTDLMAKMQATRMQMALVIDEFGGTDGLVSLEDIVETVVGDILDEHDEDDAPMIVRVADGVWTADARIDLDDAAAAFGSDFVVPDSIEEVETLGGLLFSLIGRVPVRGELISSPELSEYEMEVLDADPRRIKRLRIFHKRDVASRRAHRRDRPETELPQSDET
ncbi:MAG: hemolysin family protein [Pseudomonadota bacterium]